MYENLTLVGLAHRLQQQRNLLKTEKGNEDRLEAQLSARMLAEKVVTVQIDEDWRAVRDEPVGRKVDYDKFLDACRDCEIAEPASAACLKRSVDLEDARALLGEPIPFDSICELKPQGPRIRIVKGKNEE